jgi:hypothetical protein
MRKSSSYDCAYLEVPHGILCIIRSQSWDFVHFWKILVVFCALFDEELPKMHKIPGKTSKYAQNPTGIFRKCKKTMIDFK